jgi:hypothetical protein
MSNFRIIDPDVIEWAKVTQRAKYEADMEARMTLKKQLKDRHSQLGRRTFYTKIAWMDV